MSQPFFWLHIKKAGGQTVRALLGERYVQTDRSTPTPFVALPREEWNDALNNFRLPLGPYDFRRALFAQRFLYGEEFAGMYKFAVVRNPYDRLVSSYLYLTGGSKKWQLLRLLGQRRAFHEFVKSLPEKWEHPNKRAYRHAATHTAPIIPDITDDSGKILMDDLLHLERLQEEFETVRQRLGIEAGGIPHQNRGARHKQYRQYYSADCRREVERLFESDIQRLGYDF